MGIAEATALARQTFMRASLWQKTVEKLKTLLKKNNAIEKANKNGIFSMTTKQLIRDILYFKFNRFLSSIYLIKLSKKYPKYFWQNNFGYGTADHIDRLKKYGVTKHHRKTFKPIHNILSPTTRETQ